MANVFLLIMDIRLLLQAMSTLFLELCISCNFLLVGNVVQIMWAMVPTLGVVLLFAYLLSDWLSPILLGGSFLYSVELLTWFLLRHCLGWQSALVGPVSTSPDHTHCCTPSIAGPFVCSGP